MDLAYKLHQRRARCLKELGDYRSAELSMKEGIESLADARLDDNKKDKLRESLNVFIKELPKESKTTVTEVNNALSVMLLPRLLKKNNLK